MTPLPFTLSPHLGTLACGLGCFPFDHGAYPPQSHSQGTSVGIRGLVGFGKLTPPIPSSALPPTDYLEAAPKCISGRTSYLRVRLAFHLYPQLIPAFCTRHGFGPPLRCYRSFNLAMGSSPGFGSNPDNTPRIMEAPPPALRSRTGQAPASRDRRRTQLRGGITSPPRGSRPIQTRFRCGSGTSVP